VEEVRVTVELAAPPLLIDAAGCEAANVYVDAVTVTLLGPVAVAYTVSPPYVTVIGSVPTARVLPGRANV
jgi:hypothetical protein